MRGLPGIDMDRAAATEMVVTTVSVPVIVWVPEVVSVALKMPTLFVSALLTGSNLEAPNRYS